MAKVQASGIIPGLVDEVWAVVGDFGGIAQWLPPLASSGLASGATGRQVGDVRQCTIDNGPSLTENQTARSDADYTYSYAILESPLPLKDYQSTITLQDKGGQTMMEWSATFDPDPGKEEELAGMVKGIYQAGIDNLIKRFGS
jgi:hypothetical protein